jgi:cytosine/adenosine deaminase-related metal-dependent hydrolase
MTSAAPGATRGAVNAHTHLYGALAPLGMPPPARAPTRFLEILERVWWRLDRALDRPALRAGARLYAAEALLHGTTTLIDHHESPGMIEGSLDVLADACAELGVRALLCYGATERNGGREEARRGLAECRRFFREQRSPRVRGVVGLHATFTVSDETLEEAAALCRELGTVCHVHVAEDAADDADARRRGYAGALERLLAHGAIPPGSILAHGVHLAATRVWAAEAAGCWIVQNPRSNEGNGVGYPHALWASARVALGTDGYPADMRVEREALERLARAHPDRERGGAAAATRRLEAGAELAAERFGGGKQAADVVERGAAGGVRRVTVDGDEVVREGRLLRADLEEIRAHAREQAARLWPRMAALA